ncbi:OLC1v1028757C3 [Oldenlandia corymbosa var. corymbosa]|uniref:OLC1v1028757C3 n=1 Tax=Oldenlandia corymbosa var. corymbosa TaxID=529605 RepID=A0AAV1CDK1_OLDCO|nr:OLC1v1028757C3 [Oldenlandia corymbosa var. corymbosa]
MGESSACLFRSFSQPSPTSPKEEDPIRRALTSSVSFGRFVSESLAWDRWSAFNQNRYLEEAERYSKPGSVAQKKAYFEAHYKNIAARKAAALLEQQCPENISSPAGNRMNERDNDPTAAMDLAQESRSEHTVTAEIHVEENQLSTDVILSVDTEDQILPHESNMETEGVEEKRLSADIIHPVDTDHQRLLQESNMEAEGVEKNIPSTDDLLSVDKDHQRLPQESNNDTEREEENKLYTDVLLSDDTDHQRLHQESNMETEGVEQVIGHPLFTDRDDQVDEGVCKEKEMKATLQVPSTLGDSASLDKNEATLPSKKPSTSDHGSKFRSVVKPRIPVYPKKGGQIGIPISKKTSNLPIPQALHMSISFTSRAFSNTNKTLPSVSRKIVDSVIHKPVASASDVSRLRVTPQPENSRTKTLMCQSVSGSISRFEKSNSLLLNGNLKQPCGSRVKSPTTISSSFSLRSEERAAKRKEFFQRLEKKLKAEAEKEPLQSKQKVKANSCSNAAWRTISSQHDDAKASSNPSTNPASTVTKKVSTRSYTPKMEKKLASEAQDTNCKPPWRFSKKKTDSFIRDAPEKNYSKATPKKTRTSENTSPNIQISMYKECLKTNASKRPMKN